MKLFQIPGEDEGFKPSLTLKILWFSSDVALWVLWIFCLIALIFSYKEIARVFALLIIILLIPTAEIRMHIMEIRHELSKKQRIHDLDELE